MWSFRRCTAFLFWEFNQFLLKLLSKFEEQTYNYYIRGAIFKYFGFTDFAKGYSELNIFCSEILKRVTLTLYKSKF